MSKTIIALGLAVLLTTPVGVLAQDASAPPSEETPPADAAADASGGAAAEGVPAAEEPANAATDAPAAADASGSESSSGEASGTETTESSASSDSSGSSGEETSEATETAAAADEEPLKFYVGAERVEATLDLSDDDLEQSYGDGKLQGGFYRARAGIRLAPGISVEGQGGFIPDDDKAVNDVKFKHFYAAYLVTTGTVLDTVEISGRVGYAWIGAKNQNADKSFDNISYGVEIALPLRVFSEAMPDIRLVAGGTVFTQERDERAYGWHYGLRYDFSL